MYEIDITDRQQSLLLDEDRIRSAARQTLEAEQVASAKISLVFVDDAEIHRINRDFLQHDYPTDVISFLLDCRQTAAANDPHAASLRGRGKFLEGEVIVSTETAVAAAQDLIWSPADEALLYTVHGLLHLAGYDDLTDDERRIMRKREREVLSLWGQTPDDGDADHALPSPPNNSERSSAVDRDAS